LLTENRLLREHRPPFNIVNTYPETYYFIVVRAEPADGEGFSRVTFQLTQNADGDVIEGRRFGVFKGRGRTRDSFGALLRLLSALSAREEGFYFPPSLVRYRPPNLHSVALPEELIPLLHAFLHGRSRSFLERLMERLLSNEFIPRFIHH